MAKMGRPKSDNPRTKQVSFFLTPEDAEYLDEYASACGFSARSTFLTAVMEALLARQFSFPAFCKLWNSIYERLEENDYPFQTDLLSMFRPNPHFPEGDLTAEEVERVIQQIRDRQPKKGK